mgnify:CR=1 FL=1|jgi:probable rRNA maturation factor
MLKIHYSQETLELASLEEQRLANLGRTVLRAHPRKSGQVSLVLTDDNHMRLLNDRHRGVGHTTDVLSFDYLADTDPSPPAPGMDLVSGEIYISRDRAQEQARDQRVSLLEEIARLTVHGLLHLAGFEHDTPEKLRTMESETDALLLTADLLPAVVSIQPETVLAGGVTGKE